MLVPQENMDTEENEKQNQMFGMHRNALNVDTQT